MKIKGFEEMDNLVKSNANFKWDNWTIVVYTDEDGYYTKDGVYKDGIWKTRYRFDMLDYGVWNIPDRFLKHVQV